VAHTFHRFDQWFCADTNVRKDLSAENNCVDTTEKKNNFVDQIYGTDTQSSITIYVVELDPASSTGDTNVRQSALHYIL
jgi:hypothetical protein